jgi:pimeloyl-ACP methyl ester carboxylesterase
MPGFEHDGLTLAYDDTGSSNRAIVFLHGLSQARTTWAPFVAGLERRLRVLRLDQRGHGESSWASSYVLDDYVTDTIAFLEAVVAEPSVIVGHSLGGVIACRIAQIRGDLVGSVLLEDPPLYVAERFEDEKGVASFFPLMQQMSREMQAREAPLEEYIAMIGNMPAMNGSGTFAQLLGPDGTRAMAEMFARLDPEIFTAAIDASAIRGVDLAAPLTCPAVLLRADPALGAAFSADDAARFLETNPDARVVLFEGTSHAIHDEQPARFTEELLAVTAGVSA